MKNKRLLILSVIAVITAILFYPSNTKKESESKEQTVEVQQDTSSTSDLTQTYTVRKLELDLDRTIGILGEIKSLQNESARLIELDRENNKPIYIIIDSPGGSVLDGAVFISTMQSLKSPVYTVCMRICASMGAMIHQYGTKRLAVDRSIIMFHPASVGSEGDVDRIKSFITTLQRYTNKMEKYVANRQGISFQEYKNKTAVEFWVDAEDALQSKVVDGVVSLDFDLKLLKKYQSPEPSDEEYKTDRLQKITW